MLSWINKYRQRKREPEVYASVTEGLKKLYRQVSCTTLILQLSFVIKYNSLQIQFVAISVCFSEFKILRWNFYFELQVKVFETISGIRI